MAKAKGNKPPKEKGSATLHDIRKNIVVGHLGADKAETLDFEEPIIMKVDQFKTERYSHEFFKLIRARLKAPLIIVVDNLDEDAIITQVGYFNALEAGLWYTIINLTTDELKQF